MKIQVGILGATGFTGAELVGFLLRHPSAEIAWLSSESQVGADYGKVYPQFAHRISDKLRTLISIPAAQATEPDIVFSCLPHAASADSLAPFMANAKTRIIDLSADFRIQEVAAYTATYEHQHPHPEWLPQVPYGLTEIHRDLIRKAKLVANPGCYSTSVLLPLIPLLKAGVIEATGIIADSKSGVSGMGKKATEASHYISCNESFSAYKIGDQHRHLPEIREQLSAAANGASLNDMLFTPHLVPMERGILSTIYTRFAKGKNLSDSQAALTAAYAREEFVRLRRDLPRTAEVARTNECHISQYAPAEGGTLIIVSVLDNMVKGASGQALQNMNLMCGLDETLGLR